MRPLAVQTISVIECDDCWARAFTKARTGWLISLKRPAIFQLVTALGLRIRPGERLRCCGTFQRHMVRLRKNSEKETRVKEGEIIRCKRRRPVFDARDLGIIMFATKRMS